jgi:membrane-bound inhibitor of C-type lysozyme
VLAAGETLTSTAYFDDDDGDLNLDLRNSSFSLLVRASSTSDNETITYTNTSTSAQTFYLYVWWSGGDPGVPGVGYELENLIDGPGVCTDDELEPNQNTSQAAVLDEGEHRNLRMCNGNVEYYRFVLAAGERINVTALFDDDEMDLNMDIRNSAFSLLRRASSTSDNETLSYLNTSTSAQTFYLYLWQSGGDPGEPGVDYVLDFDIVGARICVEDAYEPNQNTSQAPVIDEGLHEGMRLCNGNVDYYRVVLGGGETMNATMLFDDDEMDLNFDVRNSSFSLLLRASSTSDNEVLSYTNTSTSAQTFYLYVWQSGSDPGNPGLDYTLDLQIEGPGRCTDDFFEPNNNTSQAPQVDGQVYSNLQLCADTDYFRLVLAGGERVDLTLLFDDDESDVNVDLRNSAFSLLVRASSTSDNEVLGYTNTSSAAQVFYIYVWRSGADLGDTGVVYDMDIRLSQPITQCIDDVLENNDSLLEASTLVDGQLPGVHLCAGDDDYFEVDVTTDEMLTVDAYFFEPEGDLVMELVDADGQLVEFSTGTDGHEVLEFLPTMDETLYLRVFTGRNGTQLAGVDYLLETTRTRLEALDTGAP